MSSPTTILATQLISSKTTGSPIAKPQGMIAANLTCPMSDALAASNPSNSATVTLLVSTDGGTSFVETASEVWTGGLAKDGVTPTQPGISTPLPPNATHVNGSIAFANGLLTSARLDMGFA
jgi:hypothetical protein